MAQAHAHFEITMDLKDRLILKDLGPWSAHPTITNDVEWVVAQVAERLGDRILLYLDSNGDMDRILVERGRFAGFASFHS